MNSQVVSTGTQTLGSFVSVFWKQTTGECWEDLSKEFMIFEQGNLDSVLVNEEIVSQLMIISDSKPMRVKNVKQLISGQTDVTYGSSVVSITKPNSMDGHTMNNGNSKILAQDMNRATKNIEPGTMNIGLGTENIGPGTKNIELGTKNIGPGTKDLELGTKHIELGTRNIELGTMNIEPGTKNIESGTKNIESGTKNIEPGTKNIEPGTKNIEPGTKNNEPGTKNIEPGSKNIEPKTKSIENITNTLSATFEKKTTKEKSRRNRVNKRNQMEKEEQNKTHSCLENCKMTKNTVTSNVDHFTCSVCNRRFPRKRNYEKHLKSHKEELFIQENNGCSTLDNDSNVSHTSMDKNYSKENERHSNVKEKLYRKDAKNRKCHCEYCGETFMNKAEIQNLRRVHSDTGAEITQSSGTSQLCGTVHLDKAKNSNKNVDLSQTMLSSGTALSGATDIKDSCVNVHSGRTEYGIDHSSDTVNSSGNCKNICPSSEDGHFDECSDSNIDYVKKIDKENENLDADANAVIAEKSEILKSVETYKYKKGFRIVDLPGCLNMSYVIKDGVILVSKGDNQQQNFESTKQGNTDGVNKDELQEDQNSLIIKGKNNDGTNTKDGQHVNELANRENSDFDCKGDKSDISEVTREDNFDNIQTVTENFEKQRTGKLILDKPFKCKFCNRSFREKSFYQVHELSHIIKSQKLRLKCSICLREYENISRMNSHFKNSHSDIKPYKCGVCCKSFSHKGTFDRHSSTHTKEVIFPCKYCKKNYSCKTQLNDHHKQCPLKDETLNGFEEFKCDCCNKIFVSENNLQKHKNLMRKRMNEQHECPQCGKQFKSLGKVNAHAREVHSKVKSFQCAKCGKCFATNSILNTHLRNHANSSTKPFLCSFCSKQFSNAYSCKRHEKIHNGCENMDKKDQGMCTICNRWIVKSFLHQHLLKHMGLQLKTHVCTICNKQFATKYNLAIHNRIHSEIKPFSCEQCDKSFITKSSLNRHLRFHAGFKRESKYPCEVCGKTFTLNHRRKRHQATHAEYAAFECVYCRYKFHTQEELHTHLISNVKCSVGLYTNVTMATNCSNVKVKLVGKECQVVEVSDTEN